MFVTNVCSVFCVGSMVELSRIAYQERELPVSQKKSEFILAKKTVMIGEVVNGGPLPNPPQHLPVCSFDSQSRYLGEGLPAEPAGSRHRGTDCFKNVFHTHGIVSRNVCDTNQVSSQFVVVHIPGQ